MMKILKNSPKVCRGKDASELKIEKNIKIFILKESNQEMMEKFLEQYYKQFKEVRKEPFKKVLLIFVSNECKNFEEEKPIFELFMSIENILTLKRISNKYDEIFIFEDSKEVDKFRISTG